MIERSMFYGAKRETFNRAKNLRENMTESEKVLWESMIKSKLGVKFRRQHPISYYIADFYCHKLKLVIELDGKIHDTLEQKEWDEGRTAEMEEFGIIIIRFKNYEILNSLEEVLDTIKKIIHEMSK